MFKHIFVLTQTGGGFIVPSIIWALAEAPLRTAYGITVLIVPF